MSEFTEKISEKYNDEDAPEVIKNALNHINFMLYSYARNEGNNNSLYKESYMDVTAMYAQLQLAYLNLYKELME